MIVVRKETSALGKSDASKSRREFLRWGFFFALGIGIPLITESLAKTDIVATRLAPGASSPPTNLAAEEAQATFLRVRVVYFQMGQYVRVNDEYFSIRSPACVRDLLNNVMMRHPAISPQMISSMWVLLDGTPSKTSASLKDGDEVDLIPLVAGG